MILNEINFNNQELNIYNIDRYDLLESIELMEDEYKNSLEAYNNYLDKQIQYFNRRYVMVRDIYKLRLNEFNRLIKRIKKEFKNEKLKFKPCIIKIPNKDFNKIPIISKIPHPMKYINEELFGDEEYYSEINSQFYTRFITRITNNKCTFNSIDNLVFFEDKKCDIEDDLLKNIDKLKFPYNDYKFILDYINNCIRSLNSLKNIDTSISFDDLYGNLDNCVSIYKNTIDILLRIFHIKLNIIFNGPICIPETNTIIKESFYNNINLFIEKNSLMENSFSEYDIKKCNEYKKKCLLNKINYLYEFVNNAYNLIDTNKKIEFSISEAYYLGTLEKEKILRANDEENTYIYECKYSYDCINKKYDKNINNLLDEYYEIINELNDLKNRILNQKESHYYELYNESAYKLGMRLQDELVKLKNKITPNVKKELFNDPMFNAIFYDKCIDITVYAQLINKISIINPEIKSDFEKFFNTKSLLYKNLKNKDSDKVNDKEPIELNEKLIKKIIAFYDKCIL